MKKVGLMQPYLFPYIGYFQLVKAVDDYVIYDDVQFIKGGWINRNNILINGQKILFTMSLSDASPNKLINEIDIRQDFQKLMRTLSMAYARAPYKEPTLELIGKIFAYEDRNLARFIGNSIQEVAAHLNLDTRFLYSSGLQKDNALKAQDKVIAICKERQAEMYINAIGGRELYDHASFQAEGIELRFLKPQLTEYRQLGDPFVPGLSIVDVLMFNGAEGTNKLLDAYELIK